MATPDVWQSMSTPAAATPVREAPPKQRLSTARQVPAEELGRMVVASQLERLSTAGRILKRSFDLLFSSLALLVLAPMLLLIAIAIRLDSQGPVLYISERIGRNGRRFSCFKFRTMIQNAERQQQRMRHLNLRDGVLFKVANDPRATHVGRILRKYSLDELPQFFNVVRGEMSVVGPRPPVASEVREYSLAHMRRLSVLPGITGLWQTQARHDPSFESYVSLDLAYIENWSLGLDLKIIAQTVGILLSGTGI